MSSKSQALHVCVHACVFLCLFLWSWGWDPGPFTHTCQTGAHRWAMSQPESALLRVGALDNCLRCHTVLTLEPWWPWKDFLCNHTHAVPRLEKWVPVSNNRRHESEWMLCWTGCVHHPDSSRLWGREENRAHSVGRPWLCCMGALENLRHIRSVGPVTPTLSNRHRSPALYHKAFLVGSAQCVRLPCVMW